MGSIRSAAAAAASVTAPSCIVLEHNASGQCNFKSSALFGAGLDLPVLRSKKGLSSEGLTFQTGGVARAEGSGEALPRLPVSHRFKNASFASFEQFRLAKSNRYSNVKSSIIVLGLSVHTAPVSMREKLAVPEAEWPRAIDELCEQNHIEEAAVLSTCKRMEIYVVALSWNLGVQEVIQWMSKTSGVPPQDLKEHLFVLRDRDATQHLFRVSSGLDSLVLGEGQILAQVKQVHKVGQVASKFGRNLNGLFKQAITAGKRVRCETSIASGAVSVSSAAVELAVMKLPEKAVTIPNVLIVGAGKRLMGKQGWSQDRTCVSCGTDVGLMRESFSRARPQVDAGLRRRCRQWRVRAMEDAEDNPLGEEGYWEGAEGKQQLNEIEEMLELIEEAENLKKAQSAESGPGELTSEEIKKQRAENLREELARRAKQQAEQRKQAKAMFSLGQRAYGRGVYDKSVELLEAALTNVHASSNLGGEIQIWLAMAYEAHNRHGDCIGLYRRLEASHPNKQIRRQAADLRYILEAPKLKISKEEMVSIPIIERDYDRDSKSWSQKVRDSRRKPMPKSKSKDYLEDWLVWDPPRWERNPYFWVAFTVWLTLVGVSLMFQD